MGGIGSGRHSYGGSPTCEGCAQRVDLTWLRRRGMLAPGRRTVLSFSRYGRGLGGVTLEAGVAGVHLGAEHIAYTFTGTAFDGRRRWFACPACCRPCRVLFGRDAWRCRRCHHLRYASQYSGPLVRALDRIDRVRRRIGERMGCEFEEGEDFPAKPPRMRWATYRRLLAKYDGVESAFGPALAASSFGSALGQ